VLGDFGLAWTNDVGERVTVTDEAVGSFRYRAPELADGRVDQPTRKCDIYSLGKVLYFMFSGGRVFDREIHRDAKWNLIDLRQDIRLEHVNNLLDHMITVNPEDRYSADKVARESKKIKRLITGEYAPIEGNKVSRCKFCGIGYYKPIVNSDEGFMHFFGFSSSAIQGGGRGWRAMVCDECGHVEFFRMDGAPNKWWPEVK
jgi:serine/threonine protein kinase